MPPVINVRPVEINLDFYPGSPILVTFQFPTGTLAGVTYRSFLNGRDVDGVEGLCTEATDTLTVLFTGAQSDNFDQPVQWELDLYDGTDFTPQFVGTWTPGTEGSPGATAATFRVTTPADVVVEVTSAITQVTMEGPEVNPRAPSTALAETFPRGQQPTAIISALTSRTLRLQCIPLFAGQTVTTISFLSSTTAAISSSHCWFALYSPARVLLGVTNDDTAASPWSTNTLKTLTLAAPYAVATTGLYYIGIVMDCPTPPTLVGFTGSSAGIHGLSLGMTPILGGNCVTGISSPYTPAQAPNPASVITPSVSLIYGYVA